jgi:hypothetical protein
VWSGKELSCQLGLIASALTFPTRVGANDTAPEYAATPQSKVADAKLPLAVMVVPFF